MKDFFKSIYFKLLLAFFFASMIVIHILFKWDTGISFIQAEWSAGDALLYVSGFVTTFGTMLVAYASFKTSEKSQDIANRLSEENNALQQVIAQNLYPTVNIRDIAVDLAHMEYYSSEVGYNLIQGKPKTFSPGYTYDEPYGSIVIYLNIDVCDSSKPLHKKTMAFSIENASQVLIRHIAFSRIVLRGYKDCFDAVECNNLHSPESGESILLSPNQRIDVELHVLYCDDVYEKAWEKDTGGLSVRFDITNTSISGIIFEQYIIAECTNEGLSRVYLGDRTAKSNHTERIFR